MAMNPEVKAKWVAALRSGEYSQGARALRSEDRKSFCCLGVLCDLHSKETGNTWNIDGEYLGQAGLLPVAVKDWSGVPHGYGAVVAIRERRNGLTIHNDHGESFALIADAIEEQL
jgi:hypothetical protein